MEIGIAWISSVVGIVGMREEANYKHLIELCLFIILKIEQDTNNII
jgi:hypothetical protein